MYDKIEELEEIASSIYRTGMTVQTGVNAQQKTTKKKEQYKEQEKEQYKEQEKEQYKEQEKEQYKEQENEQKMEQKKDHDQEQKKNQKKQMSQLNMFEVREVARYLFDNIFVKQCTIIF